MTTEIVYTLDFSTLVYKDVLDINIHLFLIQTIKNCIVLITGNNNYRDNVTIMGDSSLISAIEASNDFQPNQVNSIFDEIDFNSPIGTFCGCKVIRNVFATKQHILIEVDMMGHKKEMYINFRKPKQELRKEEE